MPLDASGSYPERAIESVYVSGASERKTKRPLASVLVVATCDGLLAVTVASAIGVPAALSSTVPARLPVVPAAAGFATATNDEISATANQTRSDGRSPSIP